MNPRCVVCGDARGTRYMCRACRLDPANVGWVEGRELPRDVEPGDDPREIWALGERAAREFTESDRRVARGILAGRTDAQIARETGLSRVHVGRIRARFMEAK